ncbi:hypothetical protein, partial [Vibrio lentus]|uniref:hypothetical protein n=1 Tax=Vibrio lentus TaxID=136468 RepID=UPI003984B7C1
LLTGWGIVSKRKRSAFVWVIRVGETIYVIGDTLPRIDTFYVSTVDVGCQGFACGQFHIYDVEI